MGRQVASGAGDAFERPLWRDKGEGCLRRSLRSGDKERWKQSVKRQCQKRESVPLMCSEAVFIVLPNKVCGPCTGNCVGDGNGNAAEWRNENRLLRNGRGRCMVLSCMYILKKGCNGERRASYRSSEQVCFRVGFQKRSEIPTCH